MKRLADIIIQLSLIFLLFYAESAAVADSAVELSEQEKAWLAEHPLIRIGIDAGYAPYSFLDKDGTFIGVAPDFISLIAKKLGITFEAVPDLSWPQIVQGARDRTLDVIATAVITEERKTFLDFTQIYISTPLVIMSRQDDARVKSAADLDQLTVALVEAYSSSKRVMDEHPSAKIIQVASPIEGLHAVSSGKADSYVGVLGINIYQAQKQGITNLKVAGDYDVVSNGQRLAVRNDWKVFTNILERALDSITEEERKVIYDKWIKISYVEQVDYALLWKAIVGFVVIVFLMYLHNRRLSLEISRRQTVERKLLEMNKSLVKARDEADRANKTKSEFLSVMSHELRTPLTSIKGALGLLRAGVAADIPEEEKSLLSIAYDNSYNLALLVDDILDYEKLQSGKMLLQKTNIKAEDLIRKAMSLNKGFADQYSVGFIYQQNKCGGRTINVDEQRLLQVLSNLISNAVKYSPENADIIVTTVCENNKIRITVSDQGSGVPKDFQDSVFTHFSQADTSDTREKGGTGLGLAISKEIIEHHGGIIDFEKHKEQGASFYIELDTVIAE